jgi:hypothetical protein
MLTIHEVTSASDAKHYYAEADYYSQGQETIGRWGGRLAAELGLSGTVDEVRFGRMCDNLHPETGKRLTARTNSERRVGYDFTVSVPKSASILRAFAGELDAAALDAARDRAIAGMMEEGEPDMQTRVRRDGMDIDRTTGNMVWAAFHHTTSRPVNRKKWLEWLVANDNVPGWLRAANDNIPPDMHEHTHVLCFNVTRDPVERRLKAGQFGSLKRDGEYYSAVFDALYARELERLGFVIDRQGGKKWEVAGVPQTAIDKFSKRTDEIDREASDKNITEPGRKAALGAKTRSKKQKELARDQLRAAWDAQLTDGERDALAAVYRRETAPGEKVSAAEAVRYAIAHVSEKLSVAPEREFKRVALLHGLGHVTPEAIAAALPRQGVIVRDIDGRRMATTEELQREEDFIAGFAARGQGQVCPAGVPEDFSRRLVNGKSLNDGQWEAVTGLLGSPNRVNLVEGPAGAGKSSMLGKFEEGLKRAGESSTFLATTAKATEVLQEDGFDAQTVARFLLDEKMQNAASGGTVVVDEVSMLGHKDAVRLLRIARDKDLKLVFVGDPMQHGSVPRGAFMHVLKAYGCIKPFRLKKILRQQVADDLRYLEAATLLSEGRTLEGFDTLNDMGWIKEMSAEDRYRQMASDYLQSVDEGKSCLVVSPTHKEAALITREIRELLRQAEKLGKVDHEFTRLVAVDASEPERGLATTYRPGDVLQFHQNAKGGFKKGERFIVTDPAAVPLAEAGKFSLYRPVQDVFAVKDKVRFTGTVKTLDGKHTLKNGMTKTIVEITPGGNIRLDNGWVVAANAGHFRHGFVETSFGSQGTTVKRVILGMAADSLPATNAEQMYVSASRARERMTLYTDDKEAVRRAVQRSSQKLAALDLRPKAEPARRNPKPRPWQRLRKHMERERRQAVLDRARAAWSAPGIPRGPAPPVPPSHAGRIRQEERGQAYER